MPINVFGNSSYSNDNIKVDTSRFVQKSYLGSNYIETDIDHDINLKNQYRIINLPEPISDKDAVNKIYIDTKIADIIERNNQNDDYISFIDNYNVEYKLVKYKPKIELTNISLFNLGLGSSVNSLWGYYTQSGDINYIISGRNLPTPISWRTGPSVLYNNLPYLNFQSFFLATNNYAEISRYDIHNIIKVELIKNRYSQDNIMGELSVFYKNSNNEWIELYEIGENTNINAINEWELITLTNSENNYGIKIRHNKKYSNNQTCSISKITLTPTI